MKKTCSTCGTPKPLEEFHKNKKSPDKHSARCKSCTAKKAKSVETRNQPNRLKSWADGAMSRLGLNDADY